MRKVRLVALLGLIGVAAWALRDRLIPLVRQLAGANRAADAAQWELAEAAAREAASSGSGGGDGTGASADGDDLKVIEGVGPRIEEVLKAAGITTYAKLAETRPGRLETVMKEAGTRLANPATWPEQAGRAAARDWEWLRQLQDELKGGRRIG